ncbi:MAG: hypothetical protein U0575_13985 [Phycisphaerales bacterium]
MKQRIDSGSRQPGSSAARQRSSRLVATLAIMTGLWLLSAAPASGRTPDPPIARPYRLIRLGVVIVQPSAHRFPESFENFGAPQTLDNTLGINAHGQIVGSYQPNEEEDYVHAFVWLPVDAFDLDAEDADSNPLNGIFVDLHTLAGLDEEESSAANDINDAGLVVGHFGPILATDAVAWLWDLSSYGGSPASVDSFTLHDAGMVTLSSSSTAHGINNQDPPVVSGMATEECSDGYRGFRLVYDGTPEMELLYPDAEGLFAIAIDVANTSGAEPLVVGRGFGDAEDELCDVDPNATVCEAEDFEATYWASTTTGVNFPQLGGDPVPGSAARGVNAAGDVAVGYAYTTGYPTCAKQALVWWDDDGWDVEVLGDMMPDGQSGDRSRAEAVNGSFQAEGELVAVGWNVSQGHGVYWCGTIGSWCAYDINEHVRSPIDAVPADEEEELACGLPTGWTVRDLHDQNSLGHIVGIAEIDSHFELVALTCAADLNGDFMVDGADLALALLALCGGAQSACNGIRPEDLDCDGDVDGGDWGTVLAEWSSPDLCSVRIDCGCLAPSAFGGAVDREQQFLDAIDMLGFADQAEFLEWTATASPSQFASVAQTLAVLIAGM